MAYRGQTDHYQWLRGGLELPGETNQWIQIDEVTQLSSGNYVGRNLAADGEHVGVIALSSRSYPQNAELVAYYPMSVDGKEVTGGNKPLIRHNIVQDGESSYVNGIYAYSTSSTNGGCILTARVTNSNFETFTTAVDFFPEAEGTIIFCGETSRQLGFSIRGGKLVATFNNNTISHSFTAIPVSLNAWHHFVFSYDGKERKLSVILDGIKGEFIQPRGFALDVISLSCEYKHLDLLDREWTFTDYAAGTVFKGSARNLKVFNRALRPNELVEFGL